VKVLPPATGMRGSIKAVWRRDNANPMLGPLLDSIRKRAGVLSNHSTFPYQQP